MASVGLSAFRGVGVGVAEATGFTAPGGKIMRSLSPPCWAGKTVSEARKAITAKRICGVSASSTHSARARLGTAARPICLGEHMDIGKIKYLAGSSSWGQHAHAMPKADENVLVVRRALFDELGAFQGLQPDVDRYLDVFLKRENNFFLPRSRAEDDPAFKQIIPMQYLPLAEKSFTTCAAQSPERSDWSPEARLG